MLIIEYTSNGRNIVKFRKDWTPARISRAYVPPLRTSNSTVMNCESRKPLLALSRGGKHLIVKSFLENHYVECKRPSA